MSLLHQNSTSHDIDQLMSVQYQYAGFWPRLLANMIDSFLYVAVMLPFGLLFDTPIYAETSSTYSRLDALLQLISAGIYIVCWMRFAATPGKILMGLKVLDAATGQKIRFSQALTRYVGYFISALALGLGYLWIIFDPKKQGWHDKMAKTVVVKEID